MRNCYLIICLFIELLLPVACEEHDRSLVTYHLWLTYRELPGSASPIGLPESKFFLKGYSPIFGFSPLAIFSNDFETDPFCSIRLRTEGFEEVNPFKELLWRPNELESEYQYKENKKIKMIAAFVNNESAVGSLVLSNSGQNPWQQDLIFYVKGTNILAEEKSLKKTVTVTCPQKAGFSAIDIVFDKVSLEEIIMVQEGEIYRITARLNIPAGAAAAIHFGVASASEALAAGAAAGIAGGRNVYEIAAEKEVFYNRLLSSITRIYNTDVSTRKFYQTVYLLLNGYRTEEFSDFALRYVFEEKLKKLLGQKTAPWLFWKAYEFSGDIKYLEKAIANGDDYPKMENKVLEMYNQLTLEWAGALIGKKAVYSPVKLSEGFEPNNEQKVLYMLLNGEEPKAIEAEAKKLLNYSDLKYPEIFFIIELLTKFDIKGLIPAFFEKELPFTQYYKERSVYEVMTFVDMYFKSSGVDFTRGNLCLQPLDLYKFRNIYNLRYKGNYLDIFYSHEGKYIDKILLDGQPVNTRLLYIPEADVVPVSKPGALVAAIPQNSNSTTDVTLSSNTLRKIEIQLSNWPSTPILNSIKTNSWFKVYRCVYDEKTAILNIDMDTPPLDKFKAIISITKNSKWIKKVTINWKDIAAYDGIKVEFKEKGY